MFKKNKMHGLLALGALALQTVPAMAQVTERSHELHGYGGQWSSSDYLGAMNTGTGRLKIDDGTTYGLRYSANLLYQWGVELSLGRIDTAVKSCCRAPVDLTLTGLDVSAIRHYNEGHRFVPYVGVGAGLVYPHFDRPLVFSGRGMPTVTVQGSDGVTFNVEAGMKYFVADRFLVRLDARYRFVQQIATTLDNSLSTFETTLGLGFTF